MALQPETLEKAANRRLSLYLAALGLDDDGKKLTPETVAERAVLARQFIDDAYWTIMCRMLSGTTRSEFEEMLQPDKSGEQLALSRASVAICRKVMRMPFIDIEQGERAIKVLERFQAAGRGPRAQSVP